MSEERLERVEAYFVAGGRFHDIDYARLELLKLLAEHPNVRVKVGSDYEDTDSITASSFLISYTCDIRPSENAQREISNWVEQGGRFLALHGTNAALDFSPPNPVGTPRCFPVWAELLGSQFISHPPIQLFPVEVADPNHWLVQGIDSFETDDELYLCEYHDKENLHPLLKTEWQGETPGFVEDDWSGSDPVHLVSYLKSHGQGAVLYNNLGHCRGHWDMPEAIAYYPNVDRCSWENPQYHELLRRGIRWALGQQS
ncbi:MAG: ThuA domain-containing protein [Acidimicrobiales bacterium]|nr:ThuA domain-containing protein [Acidimicrobiales bacterium]